MRILRIGILNLNSLRGRYDISFEEAPLSRHQLYAIVGPTGAGKTTVLDAITLALYAKTERNKSENDRRDGTGSVMTNGTGQCLAEVLFETPTGQYLAKWARQRARKKSGGLLQAAKHTIGRLDAVTGEVTILASKKKTTAREVERIVGLDYDRFVRSAMLTQGQFARFLKSNAGEKAEILEKITGTEIYQRIGKAAFDRHKIAAGEYDATQASLETDPALAPELRAELEAEIAAREVEADRNDAQLNATLMGINAHQALLDVATRAEATTSTLAKLKEEWLDLSPERERLSQSENVRDLRPGLDAITRLNGELGELDKRITSTQGALTEQRKIVGTAEATQRTTTEALTEFMQRLPALEEKYDEATGQEKQRANYREQLKIYERQGREAALRERTASSRMRELNKVIAEVRTSFGNLNPATLDESIDKAEVALETTRSKMSEVATWQRIRKLTDRIDTALKAHADQVKAITVYAAQKLSELSALKEAELNLDAQEDKIKLLIIRGSVETHRASLRPGEACPLCGALEHPILTQSPPASATEMALANKRLQTLQATVSHADNQLRATTETLRSSEQMKSQLLEKIEELRAEVKSVARPPGTNDQSLDALTQSAAELATREKQKRTELTKLRNLRTRVPALTAARTELTAITTRRAELSAETEENQRNLQKTEGEIKRTTERITNLLGGKRGTVEQCRAATNEERRQLTGRGTTAAGNYLRASGELDKLNERLIELTRRRADLHGEYTATNTTLQVALRGVGTDESEARRRLLTTGLEKQLRDQVTGAQTRLAAAKQRVTDTELELAQKQAAAAKHPPLQALERERDELKATLAENRQDLGRYKQRLEEDDRRRRDAAGKQAKLIGLRTERDRWANLSELIGSADGKKFRSYAQAITLQRLIDIGNRHLERINPRYRMEYDPPAAGRGEELNMIIVDQYQNDNRRTMATLSGGESFLISLALALGLSDLASGKALIQSLFIDEGFGTLDDKTLDRAMNTLEELRAQGKTIGLISHVAQLRERIQCKIHVIPQGEGYSRIEVRDGDKI